MRAPAEPGEVVAALGPRGCKLAIGGAPCPCGELSARVRWALGLPLRLNETDPEGLALLPGIGPGRAAEIFADRSARGPFRRVEDLARVRGIGPRTVERLRPYVVGDDADPACGS
jgi:competence protein ComEA